MSNVCDKCGKSVMRSNKVSHAKNRTHRICHPNIKLQTIDGVRVHICMDCKSRLNTRKLS